MREQDMIVPLKASISALERPEGWQGEDLVFQNEWSTPRYRVELTAYDTEKREIREWSFWSMEDKTHGSYDSVGQIQARAVLFEDVVAMRKLREELDKVLENEPRSRWEAFSDEELESLSGGSDELNAEIEAELDHRETKLP